MTRKPPGGETPRREPSRRGNTAVGDTRGLARWAQGHPLREWIVGTFGMLALAPILGLLAGFLLLWSGMFLGVAWQVGPQPTIDGMRFNPFTAKTDGRIVESWAAIEFDPADMPKDRSNWQPYSKISRCVVLEFDGDWGASRRAFCGTRVQFRPDFLLLDWDTLSPGVPIAFLRDESGFAVQEVRLAKTTHDWLLAHPPDDTFMLSKPPPTTAMAELREQFDRPFDIAVASWTQVMPTVPLRYDPAHPGSPMPAKYVEDRQDPWLGGWIFAVVLCIPGLLVWRIGIRVFFAGESSPAVLWVLTLLPLLALPWWGDALPKILARANKDWASIGSDMLEDITRTSRMLASDPEDATLSRGERLVWHPREGEYADTFGRIHFTKPDPAPKTPGEVRTAMCAQAAAQVAKFAPEDQLALLQRLLQDKENNRDRDQLVFTDAAEAIERDSDADPAVHRAARRFLLFGAGYPAWDVDALEKSWATPAKP
jgi:hypothetical protein